MLRLTAGGSQPQSLESGSEHAPWTDISGLALLTLFTKLYLEQELYNVFPSPHIPSLLEISSWFPLSGKSHYQLRTEELWQDKLSISQCGTFSSYNGAVDLHLPRHKRDEIQSVERRSWFKVCSLTVRVVLIATDDRVKEATVTSPSARLCSGSESNHK